MTNGTRRIGTILVATHFIVVAIHAKAHVELEVSAAGLDAVFILLAIYVAPLVACGLWWTGRDRPAVAVFTSCMGASFVYGLVEHFGFDSPDNVANLPPGTWALPFRATAVLLAVVDLVGTVLGVRWWRH